VITLEAYERLSALLRLVAMPLAHLPSEGPELAPLGSTVCSAPDLIRMCRRRSAHSNEAHTVCSRPNAASALSPPAHNAPFLATTTNQRTWIRPPVFASATFFWSSPSRAGSRRVVTSPSPLSPAMSLSSRRMIFPERVSGRSSVHSSRLGRANLRSGWRRGRGSAPRFPACPRGWPGGSRTRRSPGRSSRQTAPTTAASATFS
jgi:hypothetical protein